MVILIIVYFISLLPLFYLWRRGLLPSMSKKKIILYALPSLMIVVVAPGLPFLFLPIGYFYVAYILFRKAFSKVLFIRLSSGEIIRIPVHPSSMADASDLNRKLSEQVAQTRKA